MIGRTMRGWLALLACLVSTSPAEARSWPDAGGWTIIEHEEYCSIFLEFEGPGDTQVNLLLFLGGGALLGVSNTNWSIKDDAALELAYEVNGSRYSGGKAIGVAVSSIRNGFASKFGPDFVEDFTKSTYLRIRKGDALVDSLHLGGSAAAVAQARKCLAHVRAVADAAAREKARWAHIPKDPFAADKAVDGTLGAPSSRARAGSGNWLTNADYPDAAIRARESGVTGYKLDVGADGRVTACTITSSSGSTHLDSTACRLLARRARFTPARDANGNPTADVYVSRFRWVLPDVFPVSTYGPDLRL